jgi:hypothetical protein
MEFIHLILLELRCKYSNVIGLFPCRGKMMSAVNKKFKLQQTQIILKRIDRESQTQMVCGPNR